MRSVLSRPRAAAALLLLALAGCGDRDAPLALAVIGDSAARSQPDQRLGQPRRRDRLDEIVDRRSVERGERVLIVGGGKDDGRAVAPQGAGRR